MKILVTGGAGFIGSNLIRYLIQETEHKIVNVDKLTYAGNLDSLADLADESRLTLEKIDIVDAGAVEALFACHQPDAIMHLAAETHVDRSIDQPSAFVHTNVVGTFNLLNSACHYWNRLSTEQQATFRFHHISTDEVYGSLEPHDPGFQETTSYDPHSPYSASKAAADHLVRAWHVTYGLPILVSNSSNNYGPFQFPEKLIPAVILNAVAGRPIPVYGTGENVRDWLFVLDHVQALWKVLQSGIPGETYNIGGNHEFQNLQLVRMLCQILDRLRPVASNERLTVMQRQSITSYTELIEFVADRPGHDLRYAMDTSKIRNEIGWQPQEPSLKAFEETVRWYLNNEAWWSEMLAGRDRQSRRDSGENAIA